MAASIEYEDFEDDEFDAFVERTMQEFSTPGIAVLVVHGDKTFAKGYGLADVEQKTQVKPETLFQVGSITKSFTAAMAAHLVESPDFPSISWTTPLADLIPDDFVLDQSTPEGVWATKRITLEDALSHRTGMSRHDIIWVNGDPTPKQIVRSLRHVPVHRELRAKFEYNNTMFTSVSIAVETMLKQPFGQLLKQNIFDPLDMQRTSYSVRDALEIGKKHPESQFANGYIWDEETKEYQRIPHSDIAPSKGSGGIISNVLDCSQWMRHLIKPCDRNHALSKNAVKEMRTARSIAEPDARKPYVGPQAYCLGLYSQVYRGRELIQHAGVGPGHFSSMITVPPRSWNGDNNDKDPGWAVVVMQNTWSLAQDVVSWHLLDRYLGTPDQERFDMAEAARKGKIKKEEWMRPENVISRLFGREMDPKLPPTLPLEKYEGLYSHVAYHEFRISVLPPSSKKSAEAGKEMARSDSNSRLDKSSLALSLRPSGSQKTYLGLSATLHHVSEDWYWAHRILGASCWLSDEALRVHFVVGDDDHVQGMELQTEPGMPDFTAFFGRIQ